MRECPDNEAGCCTGVKLHQRYPVLYFCGEEVDNSAKAELARVCSAPGVDWNRLLEPNISIGLGEGAHHIRELLRSNRCVFQVIEQVSHKSIVDVPGLN